ncbi:MAG: SurA N-terminal domain-containing protein [Pseudolabrys sp.]|nr:SurA N-terminal domain-containing protein [Pseudolabrys sp.]MDP2296836.1 SurA N-terminal domain-containing protein [Pseudolabrys sp.]
MLRGIQTATSTWVGKAVMGVIMGGLIISFAVWGIGDIFRGFGQNSVAKIGGTEISIEQFRTYYTDKLQQLGQRMRRSISNDQARALGLDRQLLGQLVAETTLDEQAKRWRLGLADKDIADRITSDPAFRGPTGQFDRARFEQVIRNAGFSEARFVAEQRNVLLRRQIAQTVSGDLKVPETTLKSIVQYQGEKRSIQYIALTAAQAGDVPAASADDLAKYFDTRKVLFRAPEYRKVTLLSLSPSELAKPEAISDADAKAAYESRKASFGTPEKRELRQIVFPKPEEAAAAYERVTKGLSFADLAKERDMKDSDVEVGNVAKTDIIDPAVADAAFALKSDEVSAPVKGTFGTVLLQVGKIEPGTQKTYEDVGADLKKEMAELRARSEINTLRDKIEDERAGGATLAETAKKLNLKSVTIEAVDRSGRGLDGQPIAGLPATPDVVGSVFSTDIGVDNDALQLPPNGYLYYDVTGITPSRERALDEVKDQVAARWRDDEIAKRLQAKSDDMLTKLKAGTPIAQVAADNGVRVDTAGDMTRGRAAGFLPVKVTDAAFKIPKGAQASVDGDKPTDRFVIVVTEVTDPTFDANAPDVKQLAASLQNSFADDIVGQYIAKIEADIGVTLNQAALNQVVGGGTSRNSN